MKQRKRTLDDLMIKYGETNEIGEREILEQNMEKFRKKKDFEI